MALFVCCRGAFAHRRQTGLCLVSQRFLQWPVSAQISNPKQAALLRVLETQQMTTITSWFVVEEKRNKETQAKYVSRFIKSIPIGLLLLLRVANKFPLS